MADLRQGVSQTANTLLDLAEAMVHWRRQGDIFCCIEAWERLKMAQRVAGTSRAVDLWIEAAALLLLASEAHDLDLRRNRPPLPLGERAGVRGSNETGEHHDYA